MRVPQLTATVTPAAAGRMRSIITLRVRKYSPISVVSKTREGALQPAAAGQLWVHMGPDSSRLVSPRRPPSSAGGPAPEATAGCLPLSHTVPDCLCKALHGTSTAGRTTVVCLAVSPARALKVARRLLRNLPGGPACRSDGLSATRIRSAVVLQVLCTGNRQFLLALKKPVTRSLTAEAGWGVPGFMPATRCQPEPMKFKMAFIGIRQATSAHNEADNQRTGTPRICICQIDWR